MSTVPRLFLDEALEEGREVAAAPAQAHYLGGVLRRAAGDPVLLFNGRDGEWSARIAGLKRDRASFVPERLTRPQTPGLDLRLLVAAVKRSAMEWIVEKATELGVGLVQPVFTRRSVAERVNTGRLEGIAREAAEQCERLTVPRLAEARPLHAALDAWDGTPLLVGDERREGPPLAAVLRGRALPLGWLVGPEGGFERAELDDLRCRTFVATAALGPRILRAETAAVAGLAVMQALAGDWNSDA
ncbi:16S rRNA (uracil(1498)-N(3))-methyltransferase [Craurococcus roseus]|uniref:Ribosomal RNA small subunit methyltransferase E n=1 Tax=Craurococcus roseus TaxID=77585 RepID=A0ABN1FX95_9PROT